MYLTKISVSFYVKGLKSMIFIIAFTTIFNYLRPLKEQFCINGGFLKLTDQGLMQAAIIFCRFILIIFYSTILTVTTTPLSLADAVEKILTPLKLIKVPAHEIGLMLSMSLRFVPTLVDDTNRIMNAQRARGVDFGEGNLLKGSVPLFRSSFLYLLLVLNAQMHCDCDGSERVQRRGRKDALSEFTVEIKRYLSITSYSMPDVIRFYLKNG